MSTLNANIKLGTFLIHNVLLFCFFNSKSGIGGKRHYPEMIHDIKKKNGEPWSNMWKGLEWNVKENMIKKQ
jgi:hypothetical protein